MQTKGEEALRTALVSDMARKTADDVGVVAMRNAALLDTHDARFMMFVSAATACIGMAQGAFEAAYGKADREAVFDAIRSILNDQGLPS